jgi:hypothetical protein
MSRADEVIAVVHRIDELEAKLAQVSEPVRREIAEARAELARLIGSDGDVLANGRESKIGDAVVDALRNKPGATNAELAIAIYGEDTDKNRHKVRAQRFNLKTKGRIQHIKGRGWVVLEPASNGHDKGVVAH